MEIDQDDRDKRQPATKCILEIVQAHHKSITAGIVAQELGISVHDAGAELCAILAVVGSGSTFSWNHDQVMVFHFPSDVMQVAQRRLRREAWRTRLATAVRAGVKFLKLVTAFGLVLSLLILTCAAICAVVAALVMASRGASQQHRSHLVRQLRALMFTFRELLWCYAVFGPDRSEYGRRSFMREAAYDLWLTLSVCCGNPTSIFYWMRAGQLSHRAQHVGFSGRRIFQGDIEGSSLVRRGDWNQDDDDEPTSSSTPQRGLLDVAVEYLFGPDKTQDESSMHWKLRAAAIVHMGADSIALPILAPYAERPPASLADRDEVRRQGMAVAAFFGGVPSKSNAGEDLVFSFPELDSSIGTRRFPSDGDDDDAHFLFAGENQSIYYSTTFPTYLHERMLPFTQLKQNELLQCVGLGFLNAVGVVWFGQSLLLGGPLELANSASPIAIFLLSVLLPVLRFYAALFFVLPAARMMLLLARNHSRKQRNDRRRALADELSQA